jgi:hypothetical protein
VNVFDLQSTAFQYMRLAFVHLWNEGLGPGRPRVEVIDSRQLPCVELSLSPLEGAVSGLKLTFLTPTELKHESSILREPRFDVVFARARDRVGGLASLYQGTQLDIDFRAIGERAKLVRTISADVAQVSVERRSSRTGQVHSLGGFVGTAEYEGQVTEFLPFLRAAAWTGIGKHTVWGNGMIALSL